MGNMTGVKCRGLVRAAMRVWRDWTERGNSQSTKIILVQRVILARMHLLGDHFHVHCTIVCVSLTMYLGTRVRVAKGRHGAIQSQSTGWRKRRQST